MVLSAKSFTKRTTSSNGDGWGTGFLLVLFPEEDESNSNSSSPSRHSSKKTTTTTFLPLCSPTTPGSRRRLIHKTQSTLSICGLLVFTTFLLFTLSTFEPAAAIRSRSSSSSPVPRRFLLHTTPSSVPLTTKLSNYLFPRPHSAAATPAALQGMGTLHRRGTRAMSDLLVAHVSDEMDEHQLRSFLRILHNTGVLSRSDLVFLFPSFSSRFSNIIAEENDSFFQLLSAANITTNNGTTAPPDFPYGLTRYFPLSKSKEAKEPIWGKKRTNGGGNGGGNRSSGNSNSTTSYEQVAGPSYGSIVSFEASELDPENTLSGFIDRIPIGLRRWACYPMLLGRVRRKYKHMALTDVNDVVILNDPFTKIRNLAPESVMLWTQHIPGTGKHGGSKKGSHHSHGHNNNHPHHDEGKEAHVSTVTPGIVVGGNRGVRKLSEAILTEIVRTAISGSSSTSKGKKKGGKNPVVTESGIVNQLVRGGRVLKNVYLLVHEGEPIAEAGEIAVGLRTGQTGWGGNVVARWGSGNGNSLGGNSIRSVIDREVCCLSELQRVVYRDCLATTDQ